MFKLQSTKNSGANSWVMQRISGIALVVLMIGHYILMHYQSAFWLHLVHLCDRQKIESILSILFWIKMII